MIRIWKESSDVASESEGAGRGNKSGNGGGDARKSALDLELEALNEAINSSDNWCRVKTVGGAADSGDEDGGDGDGTRGKPEIFGGAGTFGRQDTSSNALVHAVASIHRLVG